jgi:hypothetical protein
MKQLTLLLMMGFVFFTSCKKDDDSGTGTITPDPNKIVATQPPPGFQFPKTYKESQRILDFKIWVKGNDISNKVSPDQIFEYEEWPSFQLTFINKNTIEAKDPTTGETDVVKCFFYKNGLYIIENKDTIPFPVALGDYNQFEFYDYQIKITSGGSSSSSSVFEKSTKASLEEQAENWNMTPVDTMAYLNHSLIMK